MQRVRVTVPLGVRPGQQIHVNTHAGLMAATVPAGIPPGGTFELLVPQTQTAVGPPPVAQAAYAPVPPTQAAYGGVPVAPPTQAAYGGVPVAPPMQAAYGGAPVAQPMCSQHPVYAQPAQPTYSVQPQPYPGAAAAQFPPAADGPSTGQKPEYNEVVLEIVEARRLRNTDGGMFSSGKSDPYVIVKDVKGLIGDGCRTRTVKNNLDPKWNESFKFKFNFKLSEFKFKLKDQDTGVVSSIDGDDDLGKATLEVAKLMHGAQPGQPVHTDVWLPLRKPGPGELHVRATFHLHLPMALPGCRVRVPPTFRIALAWRFKKHQPPIDLDVSVVGLDHYENIVDLVSFKKLVGFNGAVRHSGDDRSGDGDGDDETVSVDTTRLPPQVEKLAVCINSYTARPISKIKYAYLRLVVGGRTHAFYGLGKDSVPDGAIGLFMGVVQRTHDGGWEYVTTAARADGRTVQESLSAIWHYGKANLGW